MKILLGILVMVLLSFQVKATGYAHNMLIAQKILKTKKADPKAQVQSLALQIKAKATAVKPATAKSHESDAEETAVQPETAAASFSDQVARWVVRVVSTTGSVLVEKLVSLFSSSHALAMLPDNARFLSLTGNVVSYLLMPLAQR